MEYFVFFWLSVIIKINNLTYMTNLMESISFATIKEFEFLIRKQYGIWIKVLEHSIGVHRKFLPRLLTAFLRALHLNIPNKAFLKVPKNRRFLCNLILPIESWFIFRLFFEFSFQDSPISKLEFKLTSLFFWKLYFWDTSFIVLTVNKWFSEFQN